MAVEVVDEMIKGFLLRSHNYSS